MTHPRETRSQSFMREGRRALGAPLLALALVTHASQATGKDQVAPHNLTMNSASSHPSVAPISGYAVTGSEVARNGRFDDATAEWVSEKSDLQTTRSALRKSGQALRVSTTAVQKLTSGTLMPGRAYALVVKASALGGNGLVAVRFREPKSTNTYRTYSTAVTSVNAEDYRIEFTAPAYTDMAEIALLATSGTMTVESVSLKMRPPLAVTEPVASWDHSFTPSGYALVFNDEFNGPQLNRQKWFTRYLPNGEKLDRLNDENQRYADNENHAVVDGKLQLIARKKSMSVPSGINYESGMIRSDWTFRYGFLEARVKMPSGRGAWAAFWLISDVSDKGRINWPPEIDLFEFVNNVENDKVNMLHLAASTPKGTSPVWLYTDPAFRTQVQDWYAPFDFDKNWHTVGLEWTPQAITFFIDGIEVMSRAHSWTFNDGEPAGPAQILLNLAIGGAWAGRHGIDDAAFPQSMDIDWVRAYQKPN